MLAVESGKKTFPGFHLWPVRAQKGRDDAKDRYMCLEKSYFSGILSAGTNSSSTGDFFGTLQFLQLLMLCCVKVLVAQSCLTLCDRMDVVRQVPLSMEFPRQEYWGGLPFPSPGPTQESHCSQILYHLRHWRNLQCLVRHIEISDYLINEWLDVNNKEGCFHKILLICLSWLKK